MKGYVKSIVKAVWVCEEYSKSMQVQRMTAGYIEIEDTLLA